ncbi:putative uncharacterized protein DDB_G0280555 [Zeugodacus cucurbitae]|uniref:putative uncharacterized protein DDB_G0280555 n=1 Tax=Zeugodacus cucurbitae TaxID=28588 RepID=UPI00059691E4|nr:putative uncharacterized protein DDB_G0280555 [Zeugodacus cucurbitae]
MEIIETTAEGSKKQMNETLTAASLAESSGNSSLTGSSAANNSVAVTATAETRTKDNNTTTTNLTISTESNANKDIDMDIEELPLKSTTATDYTKTDEKCQQQTAKLLSTHTPAMVTQLDEHIPIISLSDGEDAVGTHQINTLQKASRKRNSVGAATADEDQSFRLKRRKIKVAGAPKMPLTGYVRYMNDRRELLRKELPSKTAIEHTKIIGEEWQKMSEDKKAPYMKAAEIDKQRYLAELHTFLKERPDVLACELAKDKQLRKSLGEAGKTVLKEKSQSVGNIKSPNKESNTNTAANKDKSRRSSEKDNSPTTLPPPATTTLETKLRRKRTPTPPTAGDTHSSQTNKNNTSHTNNNNNNHNSTTSSNHNSNATSNTTTTNTNTATAHAATTAVPGEIPIFTNEFLEHNKVFDMELRTLRKSKADLEQQNAVLEKHVENMKFGVEKMTNENDELAEKNRLLELYLDKLKAKLAHALAGLAIPSQPNGATMDNIEKYMTDLYKMATTNTHGPASLNKAKDIIRKLDLQINL